METLRQSSHYFPLEWVLRQGWRQTGTQPDTTYHVAMRQSLPVSSQAPSPPSDWLSTDALSVFCLTKERKLLGEFFCKLRTTARFIVILTMIQESLHHPAQLILTSVVTGHWAIVNLKVIQSRYQVPVSGRLKCDPTVFLCRAVFVDKKRKL